MNLYRATQTSKARIRDAEARIRSNFKVILN